VRRVLFLAVVITVVLIPQTVRAELPWVRPVPGPVVKGFDSPKTMYGAGHLGVHFAAPPGTPVRAAGGGVVSFAGRVANVLDVVVLHRGGLRTTYAFLARATVRTGDPVVRGQVIGTTGGRGPGHRGDVVHFGLRVGADYVDPMQLFAAPDLPAVVHLVPLNAAKGAG
jgi:murein DD-endopeptidase MepM/ murein hydrolase activator NlpD